MERFYIPQKFHVGETETITDQETLFKITKVLRLKPGGKIQVFNNEGFEYYATIIKTGKKELSIQIAEIVNNQAEAPINLFLYPSLIKKNRFEWMLEKCTEIGVRNFVPVISERSVIKKESAPQRWQKIIVEACQQSERVYIPAIQEPINLDQVLNSISGQIIIAQERTESSNINTALENIKFNEIVHLFIGPEGGWSQRELELFNKHKAVNLNLGKRILRSETAAVAISALLIYAK